MSPDMTAVKTFAEPDDNESESSASRGRSRSYSVETEWGGDFEPRRSGLSRVGVMLPYTGIQVMLFKRLGAPALIMTSGNRSGYPWR